MSLFSFIVTATHYQVEVFRFVTPCSVVVEHHHFRGQCCPAVGGSMDLQNGGILPQCCTASQPRRPRLESSPLRKPHIS